MAKPTEKNTYASVFMTSVGRPAKDAQKGHVRLPHIPPSTAVAVDNGSTGTYSILTTESSQSMGQVTTQVTVAHSQPRPSIGYNPPLNAHIPEVQGRGGEHSTDALDRQMLPLATANQLEQQLLE